MKVAICLSGHFRSYEKCLNTLKNSILNNFDIDIFIYTWNTIGFDGNRGDSHLINKRLNISDITNLYQPKKISIEFQKKWDASKYINKKNSGLRDSEILLGMFYGIYKSNELKSRFEIENNFKYDIVIRSRPDIFFESNLYHKDLINVKTSSGIWIPKFGNYNGLNDQFAYGDSNSMDLYSNIYNNLDKYYDLGCDWHAETMTKYNANYYNLNIFRTNLQYKLLRADGSFFKNEQNPLYGDIL